MSNASQSIKLDLVGNTHTLILASSDMLSKLSFYGDVMWFFFLKLLLCFQKSEIRMLLCCKILSLFLSERFGSY